MKNTSILAALCGALAVGLIHAADDPRGSAPAAQSPNIYWPKAEALDGTWKPPPLVKTK